MSISIRTRKHPEHLEQVISEAPRFSRGRMTKAAVVYLIGNERRGLKHYPSYRYVTRKKAYGKTFFSDAQRRKVMAMIREGLISPGGGKRTFAIRNAWVLRENGTQSSAVNAAPGVEYVQGAQQSRHERLAGWRITDQVAADNTDGMVQAANQELVRYYKEKGIVVK